MKMYQLSKTLFLSFVCVALTACVATLPSTQSDAQSSSRGETTILPAPSNAQAEEIDSAESSEQTVNLDSEEEKERYLTEVFTNPDTLDTDEDGLTDFQELMMTGTDPLVADTDGDGTDDKDEDPDEDGLRNFEEIALGTDPLLPDTDRDDLADGAEGAAGTDPLNADSDADGLSDGSEQIVGLDPLGSDSDGDGVDDGSEMVVSTASSSNGEVSVELTGVGNVAKDVRVIVPSGDVRLVDLPGQVGPSVRLIVDRDFDTARIQITFDPSLVPNGDFDGLRIRHFEPTKGWQELSAHGIDVDEGTIWGETAQQGEFVLFHMPTWEGQ